LISKTNDNKFKLLHQIITICIDKVSDTCVHKYKSDYITIIQTLMSNFTTYSKDLVEEEMK